MGAAGSKSNQDSGASGNLMLELVGLLADKEVRAKLSDLAEKLASMTRRGDDRRRAVRQRMRPRRPGWVPTAIAQVLTARGVPMRVAEIHAAVETLIGEPVSGGSIKSALYSNARGPAARFMKVAPGRYVLASAS